MTRDQYTAYCLGVKEMKLALLKEYAKSPKDFDFMFQLKLRELELIHTREAEVGEETRKEFY